jgi:hypothetical protein
MIRSAQLAFAFDRLPTELRLMLHCVRPVAGKNASEICKLSTDDLDWEHFLSLCRHHRVNSLVYRGLLAAEARIPETPLAALKTAANENAVSAFRYLSETRRLCDLLERAGISVRVLKGVPLSQMAFGDPSAREVGDIDLLIPHGTEEVADGILLAGGFYRHDPRARLTPRRRRSWQRHGKDYTYRMHRDDFELDLHWRLFRNPLMPGNTLVHANTSGEPMRFGEISLNVLPLDRTFLYLCVHGALDGWVRFKALVDIAALWSRFGAEQRRLLIGEARAHGILPELAAALRLSHELELLDEAAIEAPLQLEAGGREGRWILDYAHTVHVAHEFQPTQEKAGSWSIKRYELGLRRGLSYRFEIIRRILLRPRMWARFDLPDALFPLYPLLSPLEWVLFHSKGGAAGKARVRRRSWAKWRRLPASRKWLLVEAFAGLLAARFALALLPVRWIFRWLEKPISNPVAPPQVDAIERIRWAVLTVARYGPLSFVCFPQALAAHALLRRRGIVSIMHYGVRRSADRQMRAHTWLEVDNRMLLGGESALFFASIHSTGANNERS